MPAEQHQEFSPQPAASRATTLLRASGLVVRTVAAALRAGAPRPLGVNDRLAMIATEGAPLKEAVTIRWHDRQIPFIEAANDRDLAVALGIVHAHLRLFQIEMMRRIATGRLAEVFGAAAVELDVALRTIDFRRAGRQAESALSGTARTWMQGFVQGLNHQIRHMREFPHEFGVLDFAPEAWTLQDAMAVSRLASTDFTWKVWLRLLKLRSRTDWDRTWSRLLGSDFLPEPSLAGSGALAETMTDAFGRNGSNAYAVGGSRTKSGKPILAGDPHLSIQLPNLWLIAGMRSPSFESVGMMVPGVPVLGLGRNGHIAWGGTSLHAASSELVDLSTGTGRPVLRRRRERLTVRGGTERVVEVRDSEFGPVISDISLLGFPPQTPVALHWIGHRAGDDVTPLLKLAKARNWQEFLGATSGYSIPALNMVYADADGHIGQSMAATLPARPIDRPVDIISRATALDHWQNLLDADDLPSILDPACGYVASANDAPPEGPVAISWFFSPPDRVERLREVLGRAKGLVVADIARLQRDVVSRPAAAMRDELADLLDAAQAPRGPLQSALRAWNGEYDEASQGALAFELLVFHLIDAIHGRNGRDLYLASWDPWSLLRADLAGIAPERLRSLVGKAAKKAAKTFDRSKSWGDLHRLRLAHPMSRLPLVGRRYVSAEYPVGGSNETLMKTRHGFAGSRHRVGFGAQARHIFDLSDPDANHFVLLGGQDGWLGSATFADQVELWREGEHVRVPLRAATVAAEFAHVTRLRPPAVEAADA